MALTNKDDHNTARKLFGDLINGIVLFRKMQSGVRKLEEAKKMQNVFKLNLNEKSRRRYKSEEQKMTYINDCCANHEKLLLIYSTVILQFYLLLN